MGKYFGCWSETQQQRAGIGDLFYGHTSISKVLFLNATFFYGEVLRLLVRDTTAACRDR